MADFGSPRYRPLGALPTEPFSSPPDLHTVNGLNGSSVQYSAPITSPPLSSPRLTPGVLQDGPEVARRAAEWERQIESLDQKEMEIHQTQLRLIREQTTTFRGDLLALQQELVDLKALVARQGAMHGDLASKVDVRLGGSERGLKEANETIAKHNALHQESDRKLQQLHGGLSDHFRALQHHAGLKERLDYIEKVIGDSADKHAKALDEAHAKLELLHGRLAGVEGGHTDLKKTSADKEVKHAALQDRVAYLEQLMGDSADKHLRELDALKKDHEKHAKDSHARHAAVEQAHASVGQRLQYLEQVFGDSAERHTKEIEAMKQSVGKLHGGVQQHATVGERLAYIEQVLGDSADKHQADLAVAHAKIDKMSGHGEVLEGLKKNHAGFAKDLAQLGAEHTTWTERVAYLEKVLGDSAEKHSREIEAIKAAHNKLATESRSHTQNHSGVVEKVENIFRGHGTLQERVLYIEKVMGDSFDKHSKDVAALKNAHDSHARGQKEQQAKHASLEDRLDYIEKAIGDSADKHAAVLASQQAKLEQLHNKVGETQKQHLQHSSEFGTHKEQLDQHHYALEERLCYIEKAVGDSAEKHRRELDQLKNAHARIVGDGKDSKVKHASLEERINYIESWFKGFKAPP